MAHKALIFTKEYFPYASGSGMNAKYFAEFLARNNWSVSVVTLNYHLRLPARQQINNVAVFRVPMFFISPYFVRTVASFLLFPFYLFHIIRAERILIYGPFAGYFAVILLGRLLKKQVVFQSVLMDGDDLGTISKKYQSVSFIVRYVFSKLSVYHAITPLFAKVFQDVMGEHRVKVVQVPQGVDSTLFKPVDGDRKLELRKALGLPIDKEIILSVGNVIERKGYRELFFQLVKRESDFLYIIVGNYDNNRDHFFWHNGTEMRDLFLLGKSQLKNKVLFVGFKQNVNEYMQAADVLVHNGLQEGFPNVLLEAQACGLPVISREYGKEQRQNYAPDFSTLLSLLKERQTAKNTNYCFDLLLHEIL